MGEDERSLVPDLAALAGEILLSSGAEIFRVEETIDRICQAYGVASADAFVLSSGIFLTAGSNQERAFARVRHIPLSGTRLDRVAAVNQLSREIVAGAYTPLQAREKLLAIKHMPGKSRRTQTLAAALGSGSFCLLFGGGWSDCLVSCGAGLLLNLYLLYLVRGRLSKIAANLSGSALVTLFSVLLFLAGLGQRLDIITIGAIIPLLPGVAFTSAIRDIADQDYIAGAVRMLDAVLVTFCVAAGVGLVMAGYHLLLGGALL